MWSRIVGIQRFKNEDVWGLVNEDQTDEKYLKKSTAVSEVLDLEKPSKTTV